MGRAGESTDLSLSLSQLALEGGQDALHLPQTLLLGQVLHTRLQVPMEAVQQELLSMHTGSGELAQFPKQASH